jgi:SAM-dependent methyltransferase
MIAHATAEVHGQPSQSELPFPDQSFDLVTAVCVYHHVHELENRVLLTASIRRVLKPHGLFCLMEHNPLNPVTRLICRRCPLDWDAQLVRAKIAAGLVRSAGLEVVETAYFLYFPKAVFRYAGRLEECLRGLPLGGQYALFARRPAPHRAAQSIPRPDETE